MGIGENAIASRITHHKHREGISKDHINTLIVVVNTKEKNDVPLLDCVEWDCTSSFWEKRYENQYISFR